MQLAENDQVLRSTMRGDGSLNERDFILSIYEIPSQLAISAETFTNLGSHADGSAWQNTTIQGGIYSTRAQVDNGLHLDRLSGRRGLSLGSGVTVGDKALGGDPFAAGIRETFEVANGSFMPVTMASESGRAAFYPINRRTDFFDRFSDANKNRRDPDPLAHHVEQLFLRRHAVRDAAGRHRGDQHHQPDSDRV